MFGKDKPEVLVVGAGPVGLFTALTLVRRGVRVRIVDEAARTARHSYALALHGAALAEFETLGLLDAVLANSFRVDRVAFYEGAEPRGVLDLARLGDRHGFLAVARQDRLEGMLEDALGQAGVRVEWNHRAARFVPGDDSLVVSVERLVKDSVGYAVAHSVWLVGSSKDVPFRFVIGADGHRSLLRRQSEIEFPETGPAQQFAVFEFDLDREPPHELCIVLDRDSTDVWWPLPENRCRFSFQMAGDEPLAADTRIKDRREVDFGAMRFPVLDESLLSGLIEKRAPWLEGHPGEIHWRMAVRFERRLARRFGTGRVWLVGDAGHITGPVGAQSMNVGLREGRELALAIGDILKDGGSPDALERYGSARIAEWRGLLGLDGAVVPADRADPWFASRADRLLSCIPASGDALRAAMGELGLRWVGKA